MDIKKANMNFSAEALLDPSKVDFLKKQFQIDYLPMWHFLDNMERKTNGFRTPDGKDHIQMKEIFEAIYEFATISVSLDKADLQTRIDKLNEANLEWFTKAMNLEKEVALLKTKLLENQIIKES